MKFKYLFLSLMILVLACSVAAIAADEALLDDYKFTIPENFTIVNSTEHVISLEQDENQAIVLACLDEAKSPEQFKADLEAKGFEISDEENNFTAGIFEVRQSDISQNDIKGFIYICDDSTDDDGDDELFITFTFKSDKDDIVADNNTVTDLLKSIKEVDD